MATTPEGKVKAWIKKQILERYPDSYIYVTHIGQYGKRGVPDLVMCIKGLFVCIEVKTEVGKLTALQELEGRRIEKAEGLWFCVYGRDEKAMSEIYGCVEEIQTLRRP